ncbi:MAG: exosortase A [Erythrobacter sp.]
MPPDIATTPHSSPGLSLRAPRAWRAALAMLALASLAVIAVTLREWGEMLHQWWNIDTYAHVLLVPVVIGWLVALKRRELSGIEPRPWLPGLAIAAAGLGLWLIGRATGINLLAHAGAVGALQGAVIAAIGARASLILALPIGFGVFLVPFGDEIIPPLQAITAEIAIALTRWSGIPAAIDGIYIDTPIGLFVVAEACSGVKFLVAMVTLAVLVAFTRFRSLGRRAAFLAIAIVVPIIANGIRAWGTIYVAQSQGVEFAAGFDHIFYGWIFFAIVVFVVLAAAWRFFERNPQDYGWSAKDVDELRITARLEQASTTPVTLIAGVWALVLGASVLAAIVGPASLS